MRRLFVGVLLFFVILSVSYYGFFKGSSPTTLVVAQQSKDLSVVQPDLRSEQKGVVQNVPVSSEIVVKEERVDKQSFDQVSENNLAMNSLWVYNVGDGSIVDMVQVGVSPVAVEVSPNGWWAYVLNAGSRSISIIDVNTSSVVQTIALSDDPRSISLSPSGDLLAVVSYSSKVLLFDTKTFKNVGSVDVGKKPAYVAFSGEGKYLFVADEKTNMLEKINPYVGHAVGLAEVGKNPVSVAVSNKEKAFVVDSGSDSVSVINIADMSHAKKYDIVVGLNPVSVVFDSDQKFAYVANYGGDSVSVFDVDTYKNIVDIGVGKSPVSLAYNSFSQKNVLYVANEGSDVVSVVDTSINKEIKRWKTGIKPSSLAVSPDGKFLFVTMKGKNLQ